MTDNVSDGLRAVAQSVAGVSMMVSLIVKVTLIYLTHALQPLQIFFFGLFVKKWKT